MTGRIVNILCKAYVAPRQVIFNAVVSYYADTMELISAEPFERETAATSHYDGVVVNGSIPDGSEPTFCIDGLRERLTKLSVELAGSDKITLVPLVR